MLRRTMFGTVAFALIVGGFVASPAHAASSDGSMESIQSLYEKCNQTSGSRDARYLVCVTYVMAIADLMDVEGLAVMGAPDDRYASLRNVAICRDSVTTPGAMAQMFVNFAESHPERWTEPAAVGVMIALRETWPCPKPQATVDGGRG